MSEIKDFTTTIAINDHVIEVTTKVQGDLKDVLYNLKSKKEMDPPIVALSLYLMATDICERINIDIEDLVDGLMDANESFH